MLRAKTGVIAIVSLAVVLLMAGVGQAQVSTAKPTNTTRPTRTPIIKEHPTSKPTNTTRPTSTPYCLSGMSHLLELAARLGTSGVGKE